MGRNKFRICIVIFTVSVALLFVYNLVTAHIMRLNQASSVISERIVVFFSKDKEAFTIQINSTQFAIKTIEKTTSETKSTTLTTPQATEKRNSADSAVKKVFDSIYANSVWGNREKDEAGKSIIESQ
jgi:hypothetical protein